MEKKLDPLAFIKRFAPLIMLLVILSSALWLRSLPARFGEIQALDPFFFYRMGLEVMDNNWQLGIDYMRYPPAGIDTWNAHYMLPIYLPAFVFTFINLLGLNLHYLPFAIMWPAVLGALAVAAMYLLGKELFDSRKAGLFAAFFLATIPAFITRTSAGFFEKEPIAGVFILTSVYFFVRAFKRSSWTSGIVSGASLAMVSLAWGGVQYIYAVFAGFLILVFVANALATVLDNLFSGFGGFVKALERYMSIDMIKAYLPLMLIGTLVQQPFARRINIDNISITASFGVMAILLIRYGAERFSLIKKEHLPYAVPVMLLLTISGGLVGSMFSDSLANDIGTLTTYLTFGKGVIGTTVAENAPGSWNNIASTTGTGFATAIVPQLDSLSPLLSIWIMMFLGAGLLVYRFFRTRDYLMLFGVVWFASAIFGVFYYVRLLFLIGPPAALLAGFFMSWIVDRLGRLKSLSRAISTSIPLTVSHIVIIIVVALVVTVNFASAYAYSLNIGPSICFPRYRSNNPLDVEPCITIDDVGNEVMASNQPWYEAFTFLSEETPKDASLLSWWDFGYWFQYRGERASIADGGHTGGQYPDTDVQIAGWYVDDSANWGNHTEWMKERGVDYILMDFTLPGKYGAISKIASAGEQVVGMLQFSQKGIEPRGNQSVYIFQNGQYEIWLPLDDAGGLAGTPMFLVSQNGQYFQKSYINDVCTKSGIIKTGSESPSIPGCVSISDLGIYYIPPEAEHTIFTNLMFMEGTGLPVEKVFDNKMIKIYKVLYDGETAGEEPARQENPFTQDSGITIPGTG